MTPSHERFEEGMIRIREESVQIEKVQSGVAHALAMFSYPEAAMFAIRLSIEEAVMNGFHHGNLSDPQKTVEVRWHIDNKMAVLHVIDEGDGFDPEGVPDPTLDENLEIPSGRGLMLIRAYMSFSHYHTPGNHLEMHFLKQAKS